MGVYQTFKSTAVVNNQTEKLIKFLCCKEELDNLFYSERERLHLADVQKLITLTNFQLGLFVIAIWAATMMLYFKKKFQILARSYSIASAVTLMSILVLWLSTKINFNATFVVFHQVSFKNDLWILSKESNLIKLFPQQFFADFANQVALQTIIMSTLILGISLFVSKKYVSKKH